MTTKLTLTIDDATVISAKRYAQKKGKSLSHIIENYLKSISVNPQDERPLSPKVQKLMGAVKLPDDFDYKKELGVALTKKYK